MSDDLTTSETEAVEEEAAFEMTTREEYINCACAALSVVSEINAMTKVETDRQKRIQRKCLMIIDELVGEMYDELFDEEE